MLNPNEAPPGYLAFESKDGAYCKHCFFGQGDLCGYCEEHPDAEVAPCLGFARADRAEVYFIKQPEPLERNPQMLHIVTSINQNPYIIDERTDGIFAIPVNQRWPLDVLDKNLIRQIRDHLYPQWCDEFQTVVSLYCELAEILGYEENAELYIEGEAHGMRHCARDRGYPWRVWKTLAEA